MEARRPTLDPFSFDDQAAAFERRAGLPAAVLASVTSAILTATGARADDVLLELGAGTGQVGAGLATGAVRYVGLDVSLPMLREFRDKSPHRSLLVHADANVPWPIASNSVRAMFFARSLHLLSAEVVARETARVNAGGLRVVVGGVTREDGSWRDGMRARMRDVLAREGYRGKGRGSAAKKLFEALEGFGGRRQATLRAASWEVRERPGDSLASWAGKSGLAGNDLPAELKARILDELGTWAADAFGSLAAERVATEHYELQVLSLP